MMRVVSFNLNLQYYNNRILSIDIITLCDIIIFMKALQLDAKKAVATNLKRIRIEKGLTQVELSKKTGMTQGSLSQIENGDRWPDYKTIVSICDALKCEHTEITSHPDLLDAFKKLKSLK